MSQRFADSFVFLAMLNRRDRKHAAAVQALFGLLGFHRFQFALACTLPSRT